MEIHNMLVVVVLAVVGLVASDVNNSRTLSDGSEYIETETVNGDKYSNKESTNENDAEYSVGGQRIREGDMLYPWEAPGAQIRQAINPSANGNPTCRRWPNGVLLYNREPSLSNAAWSQLVQAMNLWSSLTCVRFQPINGNTNQPYVKFLDPGRRSCYAHVGRVCWINGYNELALGPGCYSSIGTPAHELGHSLGVYHQHARSDRNSYVTIVTNNVNPRYANNFQQLTTTQSDNFDVPYDYCSVMHYFNRAFSVNGGLTIITRQSAYQNLIGQRNGLSFGDIMLVNAMYKCAAHCSSSLKCRAGCFMNKHCSCYCPDTTPPCNNYRAGRNPRTESATGTTVPTSCIRRYSIRWYSYVRIIHSNTAPQTCTYYLKNEGRYAGYNRLYINLYYIRILPQKTPCNSYVAINFSGYSSFPSYTHVCSYYTRRSGYSWGNTISFQVRQDGSRNQYYVYGYVQVVR